MNDKNAFDRMRETPEFVARMAAQAEAGFEEGKVKLVLKESGFRSVPKAVAVLLQREAEFSGTTAVTLRAFNAEHQTYPLYLGSSRLGGVQLHTHPAAMLPALFKAAQKAPFASRYAAFVAENAGRFAGRTPALVFPRKGIKNGLAVYAADRPDAFGFLPRETAVVVNRGDDWLVVRSFLSLLRAVHAGGEGWTPGG